MQNLYRHFDSDGRLLYVGISLSAVSRLRQHATSSHWFKEIARVEIEKLPSREAALNAERHAIHNEKPIHNLMRPGVAAVKEAEAAHNSEESRKNLLRRVVAFNPTYSPNEVGELLGIAVARVKLLMQQGKIGCVRIGKRRSGKGEYEIFRITGWQLIDFLENAQESGEI